MARLMLFAALLAAATASQLQAQADRPIGNPTPAQQYPATSGAHYDQSATHTFKVPDAIAVQAVHNFGSCIAEMTPQGARELLAMDFQTRDYQQKIRALARGHADQRCMLGYAHLRTNPTLLAGALAEALLKSDVRPTLLPQRLAYRADRQPIQAHGPLEKVALCTVMANPDATIRLFGTEPATAEEDKAMQPIDNDLAGCVQKDQKVALDKPALRSLLALAAWRIANAPTLTPQ